MAKIGVQVRDMARDRVKAMTLMHCVFPPLRRHCPLQSSFLKSFDTATKNLHHSMINMDLFCVQSPDIS